MSKKVYNAPVNTKEGNKRKRVHPTSESEDINLQHHIIIMGNRAVIKCKEGKSGVGVYLHWNGGRDSVEGFLATCDIRGYRSPETDNYGWSHLCAVCVMFFGFDGLNIGIDVVDRLDQDNCDNGVYIIEDWHIVGREFYRYDKEQQNYDLLEFVTELDEEFPKELQLGAEEVKKRLIEKGWIKGE